MNVIDLVGFFLILGSLTFLFLHHVWKLFQPKKEMHTKRDRPSITYDLEKEEEVAPQKNSIFKPQPVSQLKSGVTQGMVRRSSRAKLLLKRLPTKKEMVILHEIIGPPKSLQ